MTFGRLTFPLLVIASLLIPPSTANAQYYAYGLDIYYVYPPPPGDVLVWGSYLSIYVSGYRPCMRAQIIDPTGTIRFDTTLLCGSGTQTFGTGFPTPRPYGTWALRVDYYAQDIYSGTYYYLGTGLDHAYVPNLPCTGYRTAEMLLKTFIKCPYVEGVPPITYDFYKGDGRDFLYGYNAGSSRSKQQVSMTADPLFPNGQVGSKQQNFGQSKGYDDGAINTGSGDCPYSLKAGYQPACTAQGTGTKILTPLRTDSNEVQLGITLEANNGCATTACSIDANLLVRFRQVCNQGILGPMEYKLSGSHDGFPWWEMYLNAALEYSKSGSSYGPIILCSPLPVTLNKPWRPVP